MKTDSLASVANGVWAGVGVAIVSGVVIALVYFLYPAELQQWIGPRSLLVVIAVVGVAVYALYRKLSKNVRAGRARQ